MMPIGRLYRQTPDRSRSEGIGDAELDDRRQAHVANDVVETLRAAEDPPEADDVAGALRDDAEVGAEAPAAPGREVAVADADVGNGRTVHRRIGRAGEGAGRRAEQAPVAREQAGRRRRCGAAQERAARPDDDAARGAKACRGSVARGPRGPEIDIAQEADAADLQAGAFERGQ